MKRLKTVLLTAVIIISALFVFGITAHAEEEQPVPPVAAEQEEPAQQDVTTLSVPEIKETTTGKGWIKVKFTKVENADYYAVYMSKTKDGKYKFKGSTEETKFKIKGLKNKKQKYYIKVRAVKTDGNTKIRSPFCAPKKARVYKYVKTIASAEMFSDSAFASKKLADIKKGKRVKVIKKVKRWYKISYKGEEGYVYNKTFKKVVNIKKSKLKEKNYKIYIDDWIFENGRGIYTAYNYVSDSLRYNGIAKFYKYKSAKDMQENQDEMAFHAFTHRYTSCKGYASMLKAILERQGHETYYVFAHQNKYNGVHVWCVVKTKKGYRHIDSRRRFYLLTEKELMENPRSRDLKQREKSYPPCI